MVFHRTGIIKIIWYTINLRFYAQISDESEGVAGEADDVFEGRPVLVDIVRILPGTDGVGAEVHELGRVTDASNYGRATLRPAAQTARHHTAEDVAREFGNRSGDIITVSPT